jgi:uncharacterized membrane protein
MSNATSPLPPQQPMPGVRPSPARRLRNYFLAGVLVTAPIAITLYFAWSVIDWVDEHVTALFPDRFNPNTYLPFAVPGLGLVILAVALTLIGFLTANFLGRMALRAGESVVARMPVVRSIYSAVKQIFETVLSNRTQSFSEVVLVEFPRQGMWALGLVIGKTHGEIREKIGEDMHNIYIPTTPNPTSGYLVFLPRSQMTHLEMTVEDCLKMIISGGIVVPEPRPPVRLPAVEGEP